MENPSALEALETLKASITKQWGEIPSEIVNEIQTIETLLAPVESPKEPEVA